MHPLIARFLDPRAALDVLDRGGQGAALNADERRFAEAARAHPDLTAAIIGSRDQKRASEAAENALILLGIQAAASGLPTDPELGAVTIAAQNALAAEGATVEQTGQLLAGALVEEAFSGDADPTDYDVAFVRETIEGLPALARLDTDAVDALVEKFGAATGLQNRPLAIATAEAVVRSAWAEGPQPIPAEAIEEALDALHTGSSRTPTATMMETLVRFLMVHQLVGPLRLERLLQAITDWATGRERPEPSDDDDDDDDDADQ